MMYRDSYEMSYEQYESYRKRKKEYYRNIERKRRHRMYGQATNIENLKKALTNAAIHAQSITSRSIVSEAIVRRGEFVTSLRREIKDRALSHHYPGLTDKDNWEDILEPSGNLGQEVKNIIADVRRELNRTDSSTNIARGLVSVDKQINDAMKLLKEIETINGEAEEILSDLHTLATQD